MQDVPLLTHLTQLNTVKFHGDDMLPTMATFIQRLPSVEHFTASTTGTVRYGHNVRAKLIKSKFAPTLKTLALDSSVPSYIMKKPYQLTAFQNLTTIRFQSLLDVIRYKPFFPSTLCEVEVWEHPFSLSIETSLLVRVASCSHLQLLTFLTLPQLSMRDHLAMFGANIPQMNPRSTLAVESLRSALTRQDGTAINLVWKPLPRLVAQSTSRHVEGQS